MFGGKGSGFRLSSVTQLMMFLFSLSPVEGGQAHFIGSFLYGGGVDGALVDGEGPQSTREGPQSTSGLSLPQSTNFARQGFCGGNSQWSRDGGFGVIIVEIENPEPGDLDIF